MTPFKNFSTDSTWRRRIKRGSIYVAVALMLGGQAGCGSNNGEDWEEVTTYEATKGVITTLEETEAGQFSIVDEQVTGSKDSSRVIIKRLDGSTETLTLDQARRFVQPQDTLAQVQPPPGQQHYHHHGMGHVLWWGAMGYMMGRSFNSPVQPYVYRDQARAGGSTGYTSDSRVGQELRRTAVSRTSMRPVSGRSGFFGGSGRGRSGG